MPGVETPKVPRRYCCLSHAAIALIREGQALIAQNRKVLGVRRVAETGPRALHQLWKPNDARLDDAAKQVFLGAALMRLGFALGNTRDRIAREEDIDRFVLQRHFSGFLPSGFERTLSDELKARWRDL